jgi:hypothetical protein
MTSDSGRGTQVEPDAQFRGTRFTNAHETCCVVREDGQGNTPSTIMR